MIDPLFNVKVLSCTPTPQTAVWNGMHQCYSEDFVASEIPPNEQRAGEICVKRLLSGDRGHYGPLEHPSIQFGVGFFPHSVMQQARTHRIGLSFDVQSMRYTSQRILDVIEGKRKLEEVFYLRPVGDYTDRHGKKYSYTNEMRNADIVLCTETAKLYAQKIQHGIAEEHARGIIPFDFRQHFVVSFSLRALLHFLDLRSKADAQDEIRQLCGMMWPHVENWIPEIAEWYQKKRYGKAKLAP